jgi:hypothetical protein
MILEEVNEAYLEIRENTTKKIITVIEVLSPKNKRSGEGRIAYEKKRQQILSTNHSKSIIEKIPKKSATIFSYIIIDF